MQMDRLIEWLPALAQGTWMTLVVTFASMALAVVWGLILALPRIQVGGRRRRWLSLPAEAIVEVWRGTPLLVQLFYIYYVLPFFGIEVPALAAGIIALGLNYGAYMSEVYRGAIEAIDRSQWEAADALGLPRPRTLRRVILPQAIRIVIPTFTNYLVSCFKDSSLVSIITIQELLFTGRLIAAETSEYQAIFTIVAIIYFAISFPTGRFARRLEKRMQEAIL
jgi:polar amino acid transport system permease protein